MSTLPKKSAVLVACGYYGTPYERYGSENDVGTIQEVLGRKFGFHTDNIKTLIQPTTVDIQNALNNMKDNAQEGDVLCFYFSGLVMNQFIYSSDRQFISATFFKTLASQLPVRTSFTIILESSNSARFIDPVETNNNNTILFSACQENKTAKRVVPDVDTANAFGMFTDRIRAVVDCLGPTPPASLITNEGLVTQVNPPMEPYKQQASLRCIQQMKAKYFLDYLN